MKTIKPTLLVLAAGMGSRYGSLKQMDGVGPNGEAIIDYSVFDAIRAGFGKVVFVIRHSFEKEFREIFTAQRFGNKIELGFVFQELDNLPEGYSVPGDRVKPWGTNHAVMMADGEITAPFAVINADDFYGKDSYMVLGEYLSKLSCVENQYCMVGYRVDKTLSDFGSVSRGVCEVDKDGYLVSMVERTSIQRIDGQIYYMDGDKQVPIGDDTPVSMNMFGFTPDYFRHSERDMIKFLEENKSNPKAEFYIPTVVNNLVKAGIAKMKVLKTNAQWFGVTYKEDRPIVVGKIRSLIEAGEYPEKLW